MFNWYLIFPFKKLLWGGTNENNPFKKLSLPSCLQIWTVPSEVWAPWASLVIWWQQSQNSQKHGQRGSLKTPTGTQTSTGERGRKYKRSIKTRPKPHLESRAGREDTRKLALIAESHQDLFCVCLHTTVEKKKRCINLLPVESKNMRKWGSLGKRKRNNSIIRRQPTVYGKDTVSADVIIIIISTTSHDLRLPIPYMLLLLSRHLTLMPAKRDTARSGRRARNVLSTRMVPNCS